MINKIPAGYTSVTPYIIFSDVKKAINLYEKAFAAKKVICMEDETGKVKHAEIQIGNAMLMMSEPCEAHGKIMKSVEENKDLSSMSFYVYVNDVKDILQKSLQVGMKKKSELEDAFWGDRMVALVDPFGIQWTVAERVLEVSQEYIEQNSNTKNI